MKKQIFLNPQTGEFEERTDGAPASGDAPRRSWKKGGEEGTYDFKFEFEGSTIFSHFVPDFKDTEEQKEALAQTGRQLTQKANALDAAQKDDENPLSPERARELEKQLVAETEALQVRQAEIARATVTACVCGWKDGPFPFSREALDELPDAMCVEWERTISDQSRLSQASAGFLDRKSSPSSVDTNSDGSAPKI